MHDVRQSAFALLGDLAAFCFVHLQPQLQFFMPLIIQQLDNAVDVEQSAVCNNACWAAGEISLKWKTDMSAFVPALMTRLIPLLNHPQTSRSLRENCAITIGRLGQSMSDLLAPELAGFAENWCRSVRHTRDNPEKESAFQGFCAIVLRNPNAMSKCLPIFCDAVANCQMISPQLKETFGTVLNGFKSMMGADKWTAYVAAFPPALRQRLHDKYQL